jgi:hypothetical protein
MPVGSHRVTPDHSLEPCVGFQPFFCLAQRNARQYARPPERAAQLHPRENFFLAFTERSRPHAWRRRERSGPSVAAISIEKIACVIASVFAVICHRTVSLQPLQEASQLDAFSERQLSVEQLGFDQCLNIFQAGDPHIESHVPQTLRQELNEIPIRITCRFVDRFH